MSKVMKWLLLSVALVVFTACGGGGSDDTSTDSSNVNSDINLTKGLVAHYEFEGNAKDSSGNGNDGVAHGGVTYVDGVIGKAAKFDGVDDWIKLQKTNFLNNESQVTINMFIQSNIDDSSFHQLFASGDERNGNDPITLQIKNNKLNDFGFTDTVNKVGINIGGEQNSKIKFENNQWYMLTVVLNKSELKIFKNGVLIQNIHNENFTQITYDVDMDTYIGSIHTAQLWKGLIDDLRIYNRALSEEEIEKLYEMGDANIIEGKYLKLSTMPSKNKSLTFKYNYDGENCSINFHDGSSEIELDSCIGSVEHTFTKEHVYFVELKSNGERIDNVGVPIENSDNKWIGFVGSLNNYVEENENYSDIVKDGRIYIPPSLSNQSYYWTNYRFIKPYILSQVDGDNCIIESRVKVPYSEGGIEAYDIHLAVLGDTGYSGWVTFMGASWGQSWDSIGAVQSSDRDLPQLIKDFSNWKTIKLEIKNQEIKAYYEGSLVYTKHYEGKIGKIYGIRQSFKGSGSIDWVKLYNREGKLIYSEDF